MINRLKKFVKRISSLNKKNYNVKLVNFDGTIEENSFILSYQLTGKTTTVSEEPARAVDNPLNLKGLSKEDSEIIYDLALSEPNYRILNIIFEPIGSYLWIENIYSSECFKIKIQEIFDDHLFIENFDRNSVISIMALYSLELAQKQQDLLQQLRSQISSVAPLRIIK